MRFFLFFLARKACAVSRLLKNRVGRPLLDKAVNGGSPINQAGEGRLRRELGTRLSHKI